MAKKKSMPGGVLDGEAKRVLRSYLGTSYDYVRRLADTKWMQNIFEAV